MIKKPPLTGAKKIGCVLIALMCTLQVLAQRQVPKNLNNFDNRTFHFGFAIGFNQGKFKMKSEPEFFLPDSILGISPDQAPGFNIIIISQWHMNKNVGLRFTPGLSFQDRLLNYKIIDSKTRTGFVITEQRVEATNLDFPLTLKLRTNRINNFAAYALAGCKFSIDMASQQDVDQNLNSDLIIKTRQNDFAWEVGGGFDFFLPFFKFGIELKQSFGLSNVLIQDNTTFAAPLGSLRNNLFQISFTFEG